VQLWLAAPGPASERAALACTDAERTRTSRLPPAARA